MSKTSVFRAIKSGRLSATRDDNGGIRIDPAELARAFPPKPFQQERSRRAFQEPEGTADGMAERERNATVAALETEVRLLRQMLDDMRTERDRWHSQAERLALPGPPKRPWWPWRRSA